MLYHVARISMYHSLRESTRHVYRLLNGISSDCSSSFIIRLKKNHMSQMLTSTSVAVICTRRVPVAMTGNHAVHFGQLGDERVGNVVVYIALSHAQSDVALIVFGGIDGGNQYTVQGAGGAGCCIDEGDGVQTIVAIPLHTDAIHTQLISACPQGVPCFRDVIVKDATTSVHTWLVLFLFVVISSGTAVCEGRYNLLPGPDVQPPAPITHVSDKAVAGVR